MKTKTLLLMFSVILSTVSFSQDIKQSKEIYFEGTVVDEWLGDGAFFITIKITKGDLIGMVERLYFSVGFDDNHIIECKGDAKFDGTRYYTSRKIRGKIIESTCEFEYETESQKCYRPVELNWI